MKLSKHFFSLTDKPDPVFTPPGVDIEPTYICEVDSVTGHKRLVESGKKSNYERIQASLESTKIYNILRRYAMGDLTALGTSSGIYADIVDAPKSLLEAHQRLHRVEEEFMKLPADLRAQFDHDPRVFIAEMANGEGLEKLKTFTKEMSFTGEKDDSITSSPSVDSSKEVTQ